VVNNPRPPQPARYVGGVVFCQVSALQTDPAILPLLDFATICAVWPSQLPVRNVHNRALPGRDGRTRKPEPPAANKILTIACYRCVCGRVSSVLCIQVAFRVLVYPFAFMARKTPFDRIPRPHRYVHTDFNSSNSLNVQVRIFALRMGAARGDCTHRTGGGGQIDSR
jgi:hypothetical protein